MKLVLSRTLRVGQLIAVLMAQYRARQAGTSLRAQLVQYLRFGLSTALGGVQAGVGRLQAAV